MNTYKVLIGEEKYIIESDSRYEAKKKAAELWVKFMNLEDVVISDLTTYAANEYKIPDPEPKFTNEEVKAFITKKQPLVNK